jgi:hypothetical protein
MPMPDWAREAVDAAVAAGIVDTPEDGSYDFYRKIHGDAQEGADLTTGTNFSY